MISLGVCIWLISALFAYFLDGFAFSCCDKHLWTPRNREVVAIWSLLLGPFALIIALEFLLLTEMAEGLAHHKRCH